MKRDHSAVPVCNVEISRICSGKSTLIDRLERVLAARQSDRLGVRKAGRNFEVSIGDLEQSLGDALDAYIECYLRDREVRTLDVEKHKVSA